MEQLTGFTVANRTVEFDTAPTADVLVTIYRVTPTEPLVGWADASVIKALDMTVAQVQQLHIIEENRDWSRTNSVVLEDNVYNMRFHRVINVADPQDPQDAVTRHYMETVQGGFVQQNQALVQQATQQAGIAATKAGEASTSASAAAGSATLAQKWAESPDSPDGSPDADSPTGETMSAKEWAKYAEQIVAQIEPDKIVTDVREANGTVRVSKGNGTSTTFSVLTPSMKDKQNGVAGLDAQGKLAFSSYNYASQNEAEAGTDTRNPMNSLRTKQAITKAFSTLDYVVERGTSGNQWYELWKSGRLIQGGVVDNALAAGTSVTLLKPYKDTNYDGFVQMFTDKYKTDSGAGVWSLIPTSTTQVTLHSGIITGVKVRWFAYGEGE